MKWISGIIVIITGFMSIGVILSLFTKEHINIIDMTFIFWMIIFWMILFIPSFQIWLKNDFNRELKNLKQKRENKKGVDE